MFDGSRGLSFVQSCKPPEKRYGVQVDEKFLHHKNDLLDAFSSEYGPNEQYLINKIIYSPYNLLYIVGGIGVGKTSFCHFFITRVLRLIRHADSENLAKCPAPIYLDLLDWGEALFTENDFNKAQETFSEALCSRVEHELEDKNYLQLEEEVGTVWEEIINAEASTYHKNAAVSFIRARLRDDEADSTSLKRNYASAIDKRKAIRKDLKSDKNLRRFYLATLLSYIRERFYTNHPYCLLIVIDNIDREPMMVQQAVKMVIKPFARLSKTRIVVTARQTTFHQTFDDGVSELYDIVAYCGPSPADVIQGRINEFLSQFNDYGKFYPPTELPTLATGIKTLRDANFSRDWFTSFFLAFTGRSVRKALIIAQHLIDNSVYDPYEIGKSGVEKSGPSKNDIIRAMIIGNQETYTWTPNGIIDNLFQVKEQPAAGYLIKLRILKAVLMNDDRGMKLNALVSLLTGFGYNLDLILDALNEMLLKPKRLLWSDAVREFTSQDDITRLSNSKLFIASAGHGYAKVLYKSVQYIQEVMFDTNVPIEIFGRGYDYRKLEDRLTLVSRFCGLLLEADMREMKLFINSLGADAYIRHFGSAILLAKEILLSVQYDVQGLLGFLLEHRRDPAESFQSYVRSLGSYFEDRTLIVENFEAEIFKNGNP